MDSAGLKLKEVTYNPDADTIEIDIKKSIITIKITLSHTGMTVEIIEPLAPPAGTYKGSKDVMGTGITGTIVIDDASTFDIEVTADDGTDVTCKKEAYKISGSEIVVVNKD